MRKMENTKKIDLMALLNDLFTSHEGNLPRLFYVGPILILSLIHI